MEKYLVINGGSSSLKFSLYENNNGTYNEIISGLVERIGQKVGNLVLKDKNKTSESVCVENHTQAIKIMLDKLIEKKYLNSINEIKGIGHRVLHGGEYYSDSIIIDEDSLENIKSLIHFGPLHMPGEIAVIESMMEVLPNVKNIAVFDTAFHQTIPENNYLYAIPKEDSERYGIRKYGFHGTSHKYVSERIKDILKEENSKKQKEEMKVITCHLGNGSSLAAIDGDKCIDTTMGFTPLDGVVMGTRSGTIDPSIIEYLCACKNISLDECMNILNKKSGLLGISGISSDIRDLMEARKNGDERSALAIDMLERSIIKYIAQYIIELDGDVDAIVFTAGIGENVPDIRKNIINKLSKCTCLGIKLDEEANENMKFGKEGRITTNDSLINCYVIQTNEEKAILNEIDKLLKEDIKSKEDIKVLKRG